MHEVEVDAAVEAAEPWVAALHADAMALLRACELTDAELSVVLTDDPHIQALNAQWRSKDAPTDVLSFPQQEGDVSGGLLGDVVISISTAARQAEDAGHALHAELRVLLVHGLCHLLGYDHIEAGDRDLMRAEEARLLQALAAGARGLVERAEVNG